MRVEAADRPLDRTIARGRQPDLLCEPALRHSLVDSCAKRSSEKEGQKRPVYRARVLDLFLVERAVAGRRYQSDGTKVVIDGRVVQPVIDIVRLVVDSLLLEGGVCRLDRRRVEG